MLCAPPLPHTRPALRAPPVGHAASASGSGSSGNQFPKVSNGATYLLNQFQFKNKDDMNAFADSYLNGAQGYMRAGGCTQHAFEGTTPNCLISFFSFDNTKWQAQQDFWANNQALLDALDKVDYFRACYWGADIPAGLEACLQGWFSLPTCRVGVNCTDTMTTFNQKVLDNDPSKVVMLGFHDFPNAHWDGAMGDFTDFAKQYTYAHSFGNIGTGQYLVLQIFEHGDHLGKIGEAFTPWVSSGANPECAAWISESKITHYAVGGLNAAGLAAIKPYGDGPNFTSVLPTLIGGVGGAGRGMSNIMFYFATKAIADGARAEWKALMATAKASGAQIEGSITAVQGNDTTLSVVLHYATPADWAVVHKVAYESPGFIANCAKKMLHAQVDSFGSMTYELSSTFGGWESLGSCYFSDALNQQIVTSLYAEQPGDRCARRCRGSSLAVVAGVGAGGRGQGAGGRGQGGRGSRSNSGPPPAACRIRRRLLLVWLACAHAARWSAADGGPCLPPSCPSLCPCARASARSSPCSGSRPRVTTACSPPSSRTRRSSR